MATGDVTVTRMDREAAADWEFIECWHCSEYEGVFVDDLAEALAAHRLAAIPDGWRLVPIEPTDAMAEAIALEAWCCGGIAETIWRKALAAAPHPQPDKSDISLQLTREGSQP